MIDQTKRTAPSNFIMKRAAIMLLTILLGLGLAKAQMETLRDGGLVSETVILFVP